MKLAWIFFVSGRYFATRRRERGNTASFLSVAGIAVGVMTLIAVLSVMNGFQFGTIEDILEINSYHLRLTKTATQADKHWLSDQELLNTLEQIPGTRVVLPMRELQTMCGGDFSSPRVCVLRAVPRESPTIDPSLIEELNIIQGSFDLKDRASIVLGAELAGRLGLTLGDELSLVNLSGPRFNVLRPEKQSFTIQGIFKSGFYDFDLSWAYISLSDLDRYFPDSGEAVIGIKLEDENADQFVLNRIQENINRDFKIRSWRDFNRSIFSALRLEKSLMIVLLALIFVVVGFNIYQSLRRAVIERQEDIGVLKALGASPRAVQLVFIFEGLIIGVLGGFFGLLLGLLISENVNEVFNLAETIVNAVIEVFRYLFPQAAAGEEIFSIFSPAYFYLSEVPSAIPFGEVLGIFLFALISATLAAYFASRRVAGIEAARVLRYE